MSSNVVYLLHSRWLCCQSPSPRVLPHPARCTDVHHVFRGMNPEMGHNSLIMPPTPPLCTLCFQHNNHAELAHKCELVSLQRQHSTEKLWRQAVAAGYQALEAA